MCLWWVGDGTKSFGYGLANMDVAVGAGPLGQEISIEWSLWLSIIAELIYENSVLHGCTVMGLDGVYGMRRRRSWR